jgi:hypothetical protein
VAQYLILIYADEAQFAAHPDVRAGLRQEHEIYGKELGEAFLGGNGLMPGSTATSVRKAADGAASVTDGPFLETKEVLGGYYLVEAPDLDAALELAKKCPQPFGGVEVRPVMVMD